MVESWMTDQTWESEEKYDPSSNEPFWPLDYLINDLKVDKEKIEYEKLIDFKKIEWPEKDVLDFNHQEKYKVATYHYPAYDPSKTRGRIIFIHGYGDYGGRYAYFFKKFASRGFETFALDVCGFGESEGWARGVIYSGEDTLELLKRFYQKVEEKYEEMPTFYMGHSMGSLFTFAQTIDLQFASLKGIIALTPYFGLCEPYKSQARQARWIATPIAFFSPSFQLATLGDNVEEAFKQHFIRDKKCEFGVKAHSVSTIGGLVEQYNDKGKFIQLPTKVYIGEKDDFVCPEAAKKFFEEIDCERKELKIVPTSHTILADGEHIDELALDILEFFDSVLDNLDK